MSLIDDPTIRDIRLHKGVPRVVTKKLKRAAIEKHRVSIKAEVFARDDGKCRCCGGHATEMHELVSRGAGGKRSRFNSIAVCNWKSSDCHAMLQQYVIQFAFTDESKGADATIRFTMPATGLTWEG